MTKIQPTQIGGQLWYTARQVAKLHNTTERTARRWAAEGLLSGSVKLPEEKGTWLILVEVAETFEPPKPGPKLKSKNRTRVL